MKRLLLALLGLLVISSFCMAQFRLGNFNQRGIATQEQQVEGLYAAHPSLPIGSKVTITNEANDKKVEVMVIGRIPESPDRIIDLSHEAAFFLDMGATGEVAVSFPYPLDMYEGILSETGNPVDVVKPEPAVPATVPESRQAAQAETRPEAAALPETALKEPGRNKIRIIPALPDPNDNKVYRLQIGAFSVVNNADDAYNRLRSAGFNAAKENVGAMQRVFAAGVPAKVVQYAVSRLEQMGFTEVWIIE